MLPRWPCLPAASSRLLGFWGWGSWEAGAGGGCPTQGREHALGTTLATRGARALPEPGLPQHRGEGRAVRHSPHWHRPPRMGAGRRSPFSASVSPTCPSGAASVLGDGVGPGRPRKGCGSLLYRNEFTWRVCVTPPPRKGAPGVLLSTRRAAPGPQGVCPRMAGVPPMAVSPNQPWEGARPLSTVRCLGQPQPRMGPERWPREPFPPWPRAPPPEWLPQGMLAHSMGAWPWSQEVS